MNHPPYTPNTNTPTAPKPLNLVPLESPHWLDAYVAFAEAKSPMTPPDFHEAIGLWLISTVIARRLVAHMPHDDIYPNLWVMLVARSTLYAKTTAFNLARHFARRAIPHLLLPDTSTPEAMLEILSGKELDGPAQAQAGQKGQIVDEASGMLAQSGRDYMAGALELYLRLYDCPPEFERVTRGQGRVKVNGAYFTLLAASTPAMLSPFLKTGRLWANGWWPRFCLVPQPEERPPFRDSDGADEATEFTLVNALSHLHRRLPLPVHPNPPKALNVNIAPQVLQAYRDFGKAMRYDVQTDDLLEPLGAAYGRLPAQALKVAMCLGAMDWLDGDIAPWVVLEHWQRAEAIARRWAEGAQRALQLAHAQSIDERLDRVLRAVIQARDWIGVRELCRSTCLKASQVETMLAELEGAGEIETREVVKGNRTTLEARPYAQLSGAA